MLMSLLGPERFAKQTTLKIWSVHAHTSLDQPSSRLVHKIQKMVRSPCILPVFVLTYRPKASQVSFKSIKAVLPLLDRVLVHRFKAETVRIPSVHSHIENPVLTP